MTKSAAKRSRKGKSSRVKSASGRKASSSAAGRTKSKTSSAKSDITTAHLKLIVDRIRENACVPFLGAAANVTNKTRDYEGLPLGSEVAGSFIKFITFAGRDAQNLARVTLEYEFATDRLSLVGELEKTLPDNVREPSPLLKSLAKFPFRLIITTNYDRLLERALNQRKVAFESLVQPSGGFSEDRRTRRRLEELETYKGLIVYKIHGSFDLPPGTAPPAAVIITEDDYIEFLTVLGRQKGRIGIPELIVKALAPSTLLFLGYSLEDWDFRTVYKGWIEKLPAHALRRSFAFQKDPPEFWVKFWSRKGIEIYDVDLYDFAQQLEEHYTAEYGKPMPKLKAK